MISDMMLHITPVILDRALVRSRDNASSVLEHISGEFSLSRMAEEVSKLIDGTFESRPEEEKKNLKEILMAVCEMGLVYGIYVAEELKSVRVQ